jgi:hypothetical protein
MSTYRVNLEREKLHGFWRRLVRIMFLNNFYSYFSCPLYK